MEKVNATEVLRLPGVGSFAAAVLAVLREGHPVLIHARVPLNAEHPMVTLRRLGWPLRTIIVGKNLPPAYMLAMPHTPVWFSAESLQVITMNPAIYDTASED